MSDFTIIIADNLYPCNCMNAFHHTGDSSTFDCGSGQGAVSLEALCDGISDCGTNGDDESASICESEFHCSNL